MTARAIPQRLCDRAELLARSHPIATVAELLGVHYSTIYRMKARGWRMADYSSHRRPIPTDFAFTARRMTLLELASHYRAGPGVVRRWFQEKPVRPKFKPGIIRQHGKPWDSPSSVREWGTR